MGLRKQLSGVLPADALPYVSDHFDVIGDIAVLSLPVELEPYKQAIAESIVLNRKNIYTVLNKREKIEGFARTAQYECLLGKTTVTRYLEFGFSYRLMSAGHSLLPAWRMSGTG